MKTAWLVVEPSKPGSKRPTTVYSAVSVSTGCTDGFYNVGAGDLAVQREVVLLREVGRDHDFVVATGDFALHLVREEARVGG